MRDRMEFIAEAVNIIYSSKYRLYKIKTLHETHIYDRREKTILNYENHFCL